MMCDTIGVNDAGLLSVKIINCVQQGSCHFIENFGAATALSDQ